MQHLRLSALAFAVGIAFAGGAFAADGLRVSGEPARANSKDQRVETLRAPAYQDGATAIVKFQAIDARRVENLQKRNREEGSKRLQIGLARDFASEAETSAMPALKWESAPDGGQVARLAIDAPEAKGLRVGLRVSALPDNAEVRVFGSQPSAKILDAGIGADIKALRQENQVYWSPVTFGSRQTIEIYLPAGVSTKDVQLGVSGISHLIVGGMDNASLAKGVGDSGSCNINSICKNGLGSGYQNTVKAVARMGFTSGGSTYTCTGTLLNDTDNSTQVPYFYSANHCISTQSEASTLNTFWFYEASSCSDRFTTPTTTRQVNGGAQLLYSNKNADVLLLKLNNAPPSGSFFTGWDSNTIGSGTTAHAIHHPSGDIKKYSLGAYNGVATVQNSTVNGSYYSMSWQEGTTEGGSSGSGLFTTNGSEYFLRGGLYGGQASCSNTGQSASSGNVDYYSRLDLVINDLKQYLAPSGSTAGPTQVYTGAWYNPNESGWGLVMAQFGNTLFVTWYTYGGSTEPVWYIVQGNWTGTDVYTADVRRYSGPPLSTSFNPSQVSSTSAGSATLQFTSATAATFSFNVNGVNRTVSLSKIQ